MRITKCNSFLCVPKKLFNCYLLKLTPLKTNEFHVFYGFRIKSCDCKNEYGNTWLFSPKTTARGCGLHPDMTHLQECVPHYFKKAESFKPKR